MRTKHEEIKTETERRMIELREAIKRMHVRLQENMQFAEGNDSTSLTGITSSHLGTG